MVALPNRWYVIGWSVAIVLLVCLLLPALHVAQGVGHTDLEVQFVISDEDGERLRGAVVELIEINEGRATGDPIALATDDQGVVSYAFPNVIFTNAMDVFGREVDYTVDIPWWEVTVASPGKAAIQSVPLPLLARDLHARAKHVGAKKAKLEIPMQLRSVD